MIDPDLVIRKMNLIAADLEALESYGEMSPEEYLGNRINELVVERYLERIIGRMIDINYHIVTELGHPPPKDYFVSFVDVGNLNVVPVDIARAVAPAAGLRNRIVHEYDEVDAEKVHQALQFVLRDVPKYLEHVHRFVEQHGEGR